MRIVPAEATLLPLIPSTAELDLLQRIELCGRVCYKSEDKITEDSCRKFVQGIIKRGHEAVLEHASIIVKMSFADYRYLQGAINSLEERGEFIFTSYLRFTTGPTDRSIVSGNVRAWRDVAKAISVAKWLLPSCFRVIFENYPSLFPEYTSSIYNEGSDLFPVRILHPTDMVTDAERLAHVDRTIRFVCDRGVSHEIVRHRPSSYCQESTRYCNYALGKFGEETTVIDPAALGLSINAYSHWEWGCLCAEKAYFQMLAMGASPQAARSVLPNSLKTEVMMTATNSEWRHFSGLRCAPAAHPQMQEVAKKALKNLHGAETGLFDALYKEVFGG
jgi:thymidylate synthase (FAD)